MLNPVLWLVYQVLNIIWFLVIVQVIMSWLIAFNIINAYQPFVQTVNGFLHRITEPLYRPLRRYVPVYNGIDLSPLVLLVAISFVQYLIVYFSV